MSEDVELLLLADKRALEREIVGLKEQLASYRGKMGAASATIAELNAKVQELTQIPGLSEGDNEYLREDLADLCHEQWAGWMRYLFTLSTPHTHSTAGGRAETGELIPEHLVQRWRRQIGTPYANLSPEEQDSDRKEADKFLALFAAVTVTRNPVKF